MTLRDRLKQSTAALHERTEQVLRLPERGRRLDGYRQALCRFHGYYAPLEPELVRTMETAFPACKASLRRKVPWLHADLRSLGLSEADIARLPVCRRLPPIDGSADAMGCFYVLEGATLGGKILARHFATHLQLTPSRGLRFFEGYGPDAPGMWRAFVAVLNEYGQDESVHAPVIDSAARTFETLLHWFESDAQGSRHSENNGDPHRP